MTDVHFTTHLQCKLETKGPPHVLKSPLGCEGLPESARSGSDPIDGLPSSLDFFRTGGVWEGEGFLYHPFHGIRSPPRCPLYLPFSRPWYFPFTCSFAKKNSFLRQSSAEAGNLFPRVGPAFVIPNPARIWYFLQTEQTFFFIWWVLLAHAQQPSDFHNYGSLNRVTAVQILIMLWRQQNGWCGFGPLVRKSDGAVRRSADVCQIGTGFIGLCMLSE